MLPIVLLVGFSLRMAMALSSRSLWGDEIHSWYWATQPDLQSILATCFTVNHPPLYYLFLKSLLILFGEHELTFRLGSAIPGCAMLWLIYRLGKKLVGRQTALLASCLSAVSAYLAHSSGEIRSYALVGFFATANLLFFMKAQKKSKYVPYYIVSSPLIAMTEHIGIFVPFGVTLFILFQKKWRMLPAHLIALLLHIPWAMLAFYQAFDNEKIQHASRLSEYWNVAVLIKKGVGFFWHMLCGYRYSMITLENVAKELSVSPLFWAHGAVVAAAVALFCVGWMSSRRKAADLYFLTFTIFVLPLLTLLALYPIRLTARYFIFAAPFFYLTLAWQLGRVKRSLATFFLIVFTLINLLSVFRMISLPMDIMHKDDFKGMVRYLSEHADEGTAIVGSKHHHRYYVKGLGLPEKIRYFPKLSGVTSDSIRPFQKIWLVRMANMHPAVTERILKEDEPFFNGLGYERKNCERFGGADGLTYACLYERESP